MTRKEWCGLYAMMEGGWRQAKLRIDASVLMNFDANWYLRWFVERELLKTVPDAREYALTSMGHVMYRM
jgi:hypothetical protein